MSLSLDNKNVQYQPSQLCKFVHVSNNFNDMHFLHNCFISVTMMHHATFFCILITDVYLLGYFILYLQTFPVAIVIADDEYLPGWARDTLGLSDPMVDLCRNKVRIRINNKLDMFCTNFLETYQRAYKMSAQVIQTYDVCTSRAWMTYAFILKLHICI